MEKKSTRTEKILSYLQEEYPDADTRLNFANTFELLVAVVLSAQSNDDQVNKATPQLFKMYGTPDKMAKASQEELEELIRGVGLYRNKARHLLEMASVLAEDYQGEVPANFEDLLKLPGVGRKSANVIMTVGFDKPGLGVDTHVQRVAYRLGLVSDHNPAHTEAALKEQIAPAQWGKAHHLLIAHGRQVCKARKPNCGICILNDICEQNMD
ncbi:endonuclease III [Syntrophomonas palmitatica]|uniref:endonuclease III n=1 Tax=Syntrophomonas palmitatica TaxID=402877 RepID=UPI0006D276A5|nr:endonuclease III [Syntrophomonas palmitatica]